MNKAMGKRKRQLSRTAAISILLGFILICVMTIIGMSVFLRVHSIIVEGVSRYEPEYVAEASGVLRGDSLLYINKKEIVESICAEMPYINSAEVTRKFPYTLIITVTESTATAYIPFAGDALIIDTSGRVLEIDTSYIPESARDRDVIVDGIRMVEIRGVPVINVSEGQQPEIEPGYEASFHAMQEVLIAMVREGLMKSVDYIDVTNITNISFGYQDMYWVILGGLRDLRLKLTNLPATISKVTDRYPNAKGTLNMTDPINSVFLPE